MQHPQFQNDFTALQQTKLTVETIVCPNKVGLYKKEKQLKVVYIQWYKMVTAAVLIGFMALLYFVLPTNKTSQNKSIATLIKTTITRNNIVTPKRVKAATITPPKAEQPTTAIAVTSNKNNTKKSNGLVSIKNTLTNTIVTNTPPAITKPNGYKQNAIENLQTLLKNSQKNDEILVTNSDLNRTIENTIKNNIIDEPIKLPAFTNTKTNTTAQQIIYKELDTNTDEKNLLVGAIEINKDKLRGFLRKASNLFGIKQKININN